jgi:hypothetical protein
MHRRDSNYHQRDPASSFATCLTRRQAFLQYPCSSRCNGDVNEAKSATKRRTCRGGIQSAPRSGRATQAQVPRSVVPRQNHKRVQVEYLQPAGSNWGTPQRLNIASLVARSRRRRRVAAISRYDSQDPFCSEWGPEDTPDWIEGSEWEAVTLIVARDR